MTDQAKALLALAYGAVEPLPDEFLTLIARLDGCTCGGWGVTDGITYDREPCGPDCINGGKAIQERINSDRGVKCPKESHESYFWISRQSPR